jgi:microcystin-dependent protein
MSICSNCYSNCAEIQSDKCVKYTGIDNTVLGINNGDSLNYVTSALMGFLVSTLDASGIKYELEPENVCALISAELVDCTDITQKDISNALSAVICAIDTRVTALEDFDTALEAAYTPDCVPGITGTEGTHSVVQAVINHLCTVTTDLDALEANVSTNYITIGAALDAYISNFITGESEASVLGLKDRMIPYAVVEYYGPTSVFDASGAGIDKTGEGGQDWTQIYLCNGDNGTPDKRGRVGVGATSGMGGGAFPTSTDPIISGNPTYNLYSTTGANTVTLTSSQMPSHTHTGTADTAGAHTHTYTQYTLDQEVATTGSGVRALNKNNTQSGTFTTSSAGDHSHTITINAAGSGQSHNNIQPVLACYYIMYIPTV